MQISKRKVQNYSVKVKVFENFELWAVVLRFDIWGLSFYENNQDDFRDKFGSKIVIEHARSHFSGSDGLKELPAALHAVEEIIL